MSTIQQVNASIVSGKFTNDELDSIINAVKFARAKLARQTKANLTLGDNVEFVSSKTGRAMRGFVKKIAVKYITVDTGLGMWRVPANMLSIVE
jgi:hypothetical protein